MFKNIKPIGSTQDLLILEPKDNVCGNRTKGRIFFNLSFALKNETKKNKKDNIGLKSQQNNRMILS